MYVYAPHVLTSCMCAYTVHMYEDKCTFVNSMVEFLQRMSCLRLVMSIHLFQILESDCCLY